MTYEPMPVENIDQNTDAALPGEKPDLGRLAEIIIRDVERDDQASYHAATDQDGNEVLPDLVEQIETISRDAFWQVFSQSFDLPGLFIADLKPMGIQDHEKTNARAASDGIYGLLQIYYPNALQPNSETLLLVMQSVPFLIAKVMVVRDILASQKAKPVETEKPKPPRQAQQKPQSSLAEIDTWTA